MIPQLKWKICIGDAQTADEVILKCLYGSLGCIDTVIVRFDKLQVALLLSQKLAGGCAGLVVSDAELWLVAAVCERLEDFDGNDALV